MILSSGAKYNQINFSKNHVSGNARKIGVTVIWWFTFHPMVFNSFQFLWLFPIIFVVYNVFVNRVVGGKFSNYVLILISYLLYLQYNPWYAFFLLYVTAITFAGALYIGENKENRKRIAFFLVILTLLPLLVFKYYNFVNDSISDVCNILGVTNTLPGLNWAIPVGISFFSFQALGYYLDVYHKRIEPERNWWDYMLFVSFFPQLLSGPISKAQDLLPQIKTTRSFDYYKSVQALKWLLWGMFIKVVMADRLGIYVDTIFANYNKYSGLTCFFASICYSFQIYGDFAGYSLMAMGTARLLGFDLINNFNRPYLATSVTDFWKRWHISLTKWLTMHVYIAMGGNRCSRLRQYWNIMVTFLVSGVWHGANWTFIVWGGIHGLFQILEKAIGLQKSEGAWYVKLPRVIVTFLIVNFAWILFRSPNIAFAYNYLAHIFTEHTLSLEMKFGITPVLFFLPILVVIGRDIAEEYCHKVSFLSNRHPIVRWCTYIVLVLSILAIGVLDSGQFIYVSF